MSNWNRRAVELGFFRDVVSGGRGVAIALTTAAIVLTHSLPLAVAQLAQRLVCQDLGEIPPTATSRTLELENDFGIRIRIPSNYRSMLNNSAEVEIVDPGTYNLLECEKQGGQIPSNSRRTIRSVIITRIAASENVEKLMVDSIKGTGGRAVLQTYDLGNRTGVIRTSTNGRVADFWMRVRDNGPYVRIVANCRCLVVGCQCPVGERDILNILDDVILF